MKGEKMSRSLVDWPLIWLFEKLYRRVDSVWHLFDEEMKGKKIKKLSMRKKLRMFKILFFGKGISK
jgi:hypothetical protein